MSIEIIPGQKTKVLAHWLGWFAKSGNKHRAGIYDSDSIRIIQKQVKLAKKVGIDGFVVDWYGGLTDQSPPVNKAAQELLIISEYEGFEISVMLDSGIYKFRQNVDKMQVLVDETKYALDTFAQSAAYSKVHNLPLLWEFGFRETGIDTATFVTTMNHQIFLVSQFSMSPGCSGTYAWVNGLAPSSPTAYLDSYFTQRSMLSQLDVPALFCGFDDSDPVAVNQSIWPDASGKPMPARIIPRSVDVWNTCMSKIKQYCKSVPYVQIVTWNDYEEGTQLEPMAQALAGISY